MHNTFDCQDEEHLSCAHGTARKLAETIVKAATIEYDDSGSSVAVIGVRADHWRQIVMGTEKGDVCLESGLFCITRQNGDIMLIVPVEGLRYPKVLNDEEQETLLKQRRAVSR